MQMQCNETHLHCKFVQKKRKIKEKKYIFDILYIIGQNKFCIIFRSKTYDSVKMKDYTNLKNKSVFDFCTDEVVLEVVLPFIPSGVDRAQYLHDYWVQNPAQHAFSFIDLAEEIKDKELAEQAERQFAEVLSAYFNE